MAQLQTWLFLLRIDKAIAVNVIYEHGTLSIQLRYIQLFSCPSWHNLSQKKKNLNPLKCYWTTETCLNTHDSKDALAYISFEKTFLPRNICNHFFFLRCCTFTTLSTSLVKLNYKTVNPFSLLKSMFTVYVLRWCNAI